MRQLKAPGAYPRVALISVVFLLVPNSFASFIIPHSFTWYRAGRIRASAPFLLGLVRSLPAGTSAGAGPSEGAGVGAVGAGGAAGAGAAAGRTGSWSPAFYWSCSSLRESTAFPVAVTVTARLSPPAPSPYAGPTGGLTEHRAPASRPASPVRTARTSLRAPRPRPPAVPGTHQIALRPSTAPLRVPLPSPPESSLPVLADPESGSLRVASPTVARLLAAVVTDPSLESTAASALVAELVDFAARCRLDYVASLVAESESVCPPSVRGECALGTDVLEDRQEEFQCFAAALPHLVSTLIAPEGDPDAPDIPTPRSYAEAIEGPYSSQWKSAMDIEMASWKSTGTYVDEVPPPGANIVSGMWIFRVKRPPGSPPVFKARYVARGFSQRQGVDYFQTFSPTLKMTTLQVLLHVAAQRDYELHSLDFSTAFLQGSLHEEIWLRRPPGFTGSFPSGTQWSLRRPVYGLRQAPREWHDTLRTTLAALGFAPSTVDPSLFLRTDTSLPQFYILVYVDDLVFATADTAGLAHVKSELRSYLGLQITRDRAQRTITLTQSHMVQQVLQRFDFTYSSPQATPLSTRHSLSALPSDESVESSGPYPELVGCLMYLMTCTRPDLAYPLSILARYVAPGRHRPEHMAAAKRFFTRSLRFIRVLDRIMSSRLLVVRLHLARELQQRGQLRLAYVASQANTADIFTKALPPGDHQRFCTMLGFPTSYILGEAEADWVDRRGEEQEIGGGNAMGGYIQGFLRLSSPTTLMDPLSPLSTRIPAAAALPLLRIVFASGESPLLLLPRFHSPSANSRTYSAHPLPPCDIDRLAAPYAQQQALDCAQGTPCSGSTSALPALTAGTASGRWELSQDEQPQQQQQQQQQPKLLQPCNSYACNPGDGLVYEGWRENTSDGGTLGSKSSSSSKARRVVGRHGILADTMNQDAGKRALAIETSRMRHALVYRSTGVVAAASSSTIVLPFASRPAAAAGLIASSASAAATAAANAASVALRVSRGFSAHAQPAVAQVRSMESPLMSSGAAFTAVSRDGGARPALASAPAASASANRGSPAATASAGSSGGAVAEVEVDPNTTLPVPVQTDSLPAMLETRPVIEDVPHLANWIPDLRLYPSPLQRNPAYAHVETFFVEEDQVVSRDVITSINNIGTGVFFRKAGPREKIVFHPDEVRAAIVTCGGLCPGINTVIRELVWGLWFQYGVRDILGIDGGYRGIYSRNVVSLNPKVVNDIHKRGGTFLGTSRGGHEVNKIVNALEDRGINQIYVIGGDGTQRGAEKIHEEIAARGLKVTVAGIPKTIDNDLALIDKSFGFDTAVEEAQRAINAAHVEASSVHNGVGLVKLMGRFCGQIAMHATLASRDVDCCLIPEVPFHLEGDGGLFEFLKRRLRESGHAVLVVAEGAGQDIMAEALDLQLSPSGSSSHSPFSSSFAASAPFPSASSPSALAGMGGGGGMGMGMGMDGMGGGGTAAIKVRGRGRGRERGERKGEVETEGGGETLREGESGMGKVGGTQSVPAPNIPLFFSNNVCFPPFGFVCLVGCMGGWIAPHHMQAHFAKSRIELNLKYIDPTYMIRAVPANASDNIYCTLLAHSAIHGSMAGFTGFTVGPINGRHAYIPIKCVSEKSNTVSLTDRMWARLLSSTSQPTFAEVGNHEKAPAVAPPDFIPFESLDEGLCASPTAPVLEQDSSLPSAEETAAVPVAKKNARYTQSTLPWCKMGGNTGATPPSPADQQSTPATASTQVSPSVPGPSKPAGPDAIYAEALYKYKSEGLDRFSWLILLKPADGLPAFKCSICTEHAGYAGPCGRGGKGATDVQTHAFKRHAATTKHKEAFKHQENILSEAARQPRINDDNLARATEKERVIKLLDSLIFVTKQDAPIELWVNLVRYLAALKVPGFPTKGYGTYYTT
ncbi:unnamed protein product [Closterium sp. NIES-54]